MIFCACACICAEVCVLVSLLLTCVHTWLLQGFHSHLDISCTHAHVLQGQALPIFDSMEEADYPKCFLLQMWGINIDAFYAGEKKGKRNFSRAPAIGWPQHYLELSSLKTSFGIGTCDNLGRDQLESTSTKTFSGQAGHTLNWFFYPSFGVLLDLLGSGLMKWGELLQVTWSFEPDSHNPPLSHSLVSLSGGISSLRAHPRTGVSMTKSFIQNWPKWVPQSTQISSIKPYHSMNQGFKYIHILRL